MVIVKNGSSCKCEVMSAPHKCENCGIVFCGKCQVAYTLSKNRAGNMASDRCCPDCSSPTLVKLNEKIVSIRADRQQSREPASHEKGTLSAF